MLVLDRGGDNTGRRRVHERFDKDIRMILEDVCEVAALRLDGSRIDIAHLADRHRQTFVGRHARLARRLLYPALLEFGIAVDVGARRPLPGPTQPGQALFEIKEKGIALLLAIVADVDAGLGLPRYDRAQRGQAGCGNFIRGDAFSARAPNEKAGQILRSRQASRMRRQNSFRSAPHGMTLFLIGSIAPDYVRSASTVKCGASYIRPLSTPSSLISIWKF